MSPSLISLALCGLLVPSFAVQIFTNQTIPTNVTNACANALLADVKCSPMVSFLRYTDYYMNSTLNNTCTTACTSALGTYAAGISKNCNGQNWTGYTGDNMPITLIPTLLQYNYNYTCLTDSGRYCNMVAAQAAWAADPSSGDPVYGGSTASGTVATAPKNVSLCDLCLVKNLKFQAERPYYNGPDLVSAYASRTSSCSIKSLALSTTAASFTLAPSAAASKPNCTKSYTIQKGDTCYSISKSQSIGTGWLLMDNNLPAYCSNFPTNGTLCVKDTCKVYTVASNDTCTSIASKFNITQSQLISFNPVILPGCYNLDRMNGTSLCVSAPGPVYTPPTQTNLAPLTPTTPAPVPANARDNSTRNCGMWYNVAQGDYCNMIVLKFGISLPDFTFLNPTINANCTNLLSGISYCVEAVGDINTYPGRPGVISASTPASYTPWTALPSATTTSSAASNTTTPLPLANGTRDDCNYYFAGDVFQTKPAFWSSTCALAANNYNVDLDSFGTWNTALNVSDPNCGFQKGRRYCGKLYFGSQPESNDALTHAYPLRDGTIATCSYYADVTPGMTCQNVLDTYAITIAQFYKWNPSVGSDCTGLQLQYSYCVDAPDDNSVSTTTVSGKPTTTTSGAPSPTAPTQSGEPTNCIKWDVAASGDDCDKMSNRNYITRAQFLKWNPAVNSDCSSGFWAGYDYCVGTSDTVSSTRSSTTAATSTTSAVPAPTPNQANNAVSNCNKYAAAQSGDYCSAFADRNGITLANLYAWNSVLKSDGSGCSNNFWAGYYYCTGVSASK